MDEAGKRVQAVGEELATVDLGDRRLDYRAKRIAERLAASPSAGLPQVFLKPSELEGCYRLLGNPKVDPESLLKPHVQATVERASELGTVYVVHDSTEFRFGGQGRAGLGEVTKSGNGFWAHVALAISADGKRDPLGVLGVKTWIRDGSPTQTRLRKQGLSHAQVREVPTERSRWLEVVRAVESQVKQRASAIHLMDSEADNYELLWQLHDGGCRFVVRSGYERRLSEAGGVANTGEKLREFLARVEVCAEREVKISRRKKPVAHCCEERRRAPRPARIASLLISAETVVLRRPTSLASTGERSLPVNVVCVREKDPPADVTPIEWVLLTTEPIDTTEAALAVVEAYRTRWLIEEYFKALKTGCALQERQLETSKTILNAFAMYIPVAWALLRMRALSRLPDKAPIARVLTKAQIQILKKETGIPLRANSSAADAYAAVARLGGHIKNNGQPGWLVLARGYERLLLLETGFRIAKEERCDR
jgi:hypothetical protein